MVRTFSVILGTTLLLVISCLFSSAQVGVLHTVIIDETVRLSGQYINNIYTVGTGEKRVRVFDSTVGLPDPRYGERTDNYMLVDGNPRTYFVDKLEYNVDTIINETVRLSGQYINNIVEFSDESCWIIKGATDSYTVGTGEKRIRVFDSTYGLPDPRYGERTDNYMLIDGNPRTYFVEKLEYVVNTVIDETVSLSGQYIDNIVLYCWHRRETCSCI